MLTAPYIPGTRCCTTSQASNISFIRPDLWPSNSLDPKLVYYKIWAINHHGIVSVVIFRKFELLNSQGRCGEEILGYVFCNKFYTPSNSGKILKIG